MDEDGGLKTGTRFLFCIIFFAVSAPVRQKIGYFLLVRKQRNVVSPTGIIREIWYWEVKNKGSV